MLPFMPEAARQPTTCPQHLTTHLRGVHVAQVARVVHVMCSTSQCSIPNQPSHDHALQNMGMKPPLHMLVVNKDTVQLVGMPLLCQEVLRHVAPTPPTILPDIL